MERCALYNSLRMNWILDPSLPVEAWQVEDYRRIDTDDLFRRLDEEGISVNAEYVIDSSEDFNSPEDFTDYLLDDKEVDAKTYDKIYLIVFELWRRLLPESLCLSIFCDELDRQIFAHDQQHQHNFEEIQKALDNLQMVIQENIDEGVDAAEVFDEISNACANDVESFLYDFIYEQIEKNNHVYASDLLETFANIVEDPKWFDFLQARLLVDSDPLSAHFIAQQLAEDALEEQDLEFNLAVLSLLVKQGDKEVFLQLVHATIPLLEIEEDFQELLMLCADFYGCLDCDETEHHFRDILDKRTAVDVGQIIDRRDEGLQLFVELLH